jgi:hypothetical protein
VTGVSWEEYYGCFAYYGCGLDYAVMAGVLVQTGATLNQWNGPIWGVRPMLNARRVVWDS